MICFKSTSFKIIRVTLTQQLQQQVILRGQNVGTFNLVPK